MEDHQHIANTYWTLRLGIVAMVVFLFLSLFFLIGVVNDWEWGSLLDWHLLESISSYWYTPARPAFVGTLFAVGMALIVYRGNSESENFLLNFAGFVAFLIAVIPTQNDPNVPDNDDIGFVGCQDYCTGLDDELTALSMTTIAAALLTVALLAFVVALIVRRGSGKNNGETFDPWALLTIEVTGALLVVFALLLWLFPETIIEHGHNVAAATFFLAIIVDVWVNAISYARNKRRPLSQALIHIRGRNRYMDIALLMLGVLLVTLLAELFNVPWLSIFWLEVVLISLFGVYWVYQTMDLRGRPVRPMS